MGDFLFLFFVLLFNIVLFYNLFISDETDNRKTKDKNELDKDSSKPKELKKYETVFKNMPKYFVINGKRINLLIEDNNRERAYCEIVAWAASYMDGFEESKVVISQIKRKYKYCNDNKVYLQMTEKDLYTIVASVGNELNQMYEKYLILCGEDSYQTDNDNVKKNEENKFNNPNMDEFMKNINISLGEVFIDDKEFNESINKISAIIDQINNKIADNPKLKENLSLSSFIVYHEELLELLKTVEKIEKAKYKTEDMKERIKVIKGIVKDIISFYENELDKLYEIDLMNMEASVKVLKNIIKQEQ